MEQWLLLGGTEREGVLGRLLAAGSVPHFDLDHGDLGVDTSGLSKRLALNSPPAGRTATGQAAGRLGAGPLLRDPGSLPGLALCPVP